MTNPPARSDRPWYEEGLPFSCTQCGHCCKIQGYVWMNDAEITEVAEFLGIEDHQFGGRFLRRVGKRFSLIEKPNHECIFWDEGCTIYSARPTQCRTFPFWKENIADPDAWEEVVEECPGSGTGRVYSLEEIERIRDGGGEATAKEEDES